MDAEKGGTLGPLTMVICCSLAMVGIGLAGNYQSSDAASADSPSGSRDYTLLQTGGGSSVVKRDGTLSTQGSGALYYRRDGTLATQGSGSLYIKRDGTLATQGSGSLYLKRDGTLESQSSGGIIFNPRTGELGAEEAESSTAEGAAAVAVLKRGPNGIEFDPSADGFGFANYGIGPGLRTDVVGIDTESARAVLGNSAVCNSEADQCIPTDRAKRWIRAANKLASGGHCFGMALAALLGFQGDRSAGFTGPAGAQTLESQPSLQRSIATLQASQDTVEVEKARQVVTPNGAVAALTESFSKPQAERFLVTIANRNPKDGSRTQGHALVPFGIYAGVNDMSYIATYDSNAPGETTAIQIDSRANTWTYVSGGITYDGKGELQLISTSTLDHKPLHPDLDVDPPESVDN